ncbi:hypothetical protein MLD38_016354 [Melastoma candidum]|uniref:Uncharacterized protein n=1 Tax=Melastoma candidum TaxID=119954 RepID=A0ACB9RSL6_9MYRT|nr:hypothetical protein MLD38_016354 [Melastoma candidum]
MNRLDGTDARRLDRPGIPHTRKSLVSLTFCPWRLGVYPPPRIRRLCLPHVAARFTKREPRAITRRANNVVEGALCNDGDQNYSFLEEAKPELPV